MKTSDLLIGKTVAEIYVDDGVEIKFTDGTFFLFSENSPERSPDVGIVTPDDRLLTIHGYPEYDSRLARFRKG